MLEVNNLSTSGFGAQSSALGSGLVDLSGIRV